MVKCGAMQNLPRIRRSGVATSKSNHFFLARRSACRVVTCLATAIIACITLLGCTSNAPTLENKSIMRDANSGSVNIVVTTDELANLGFAFGDSVDVEFLNGYSLKGIPYFSDFYARVGQPLMVGSPELPYVQVSANNSGSLWDIAGLAEGDTAKVTLSKSGDYAGVQNAFSASFTNERRDYFSDASFANYRELSAGRLKHRVVFRSSSAFDDELNRAGYVNSLMRLSGIKYVLNLSDNDDEIVEFLAEAKAKGTDVSYAESLLADGNVAALDLDSDYSADDFMSMLSSGLVELSEHEGPYLIHCIFGRDRTGFVCMLLEALTGATYDEMRDDYMMTYTNYYGFTKNNSPEEYKAISEARFDEMLAYLAAFNKEEGGVNLKAINYEPLARDYLHAAGMTDIQIDALTARICE